MKPTVIVLGTAIALLGLGSASAQAPAANTDPSATAPPEFFPDGSPFQAGRPPLKARPAGDKAIIRTLADALGFIRGIGAGETTETLNRLMWRGSGVMTDKAGQYKVTRYTYLVSMHLNAAREDIVRTGPGGKEDRIVRVVVGDKAWDETAPGVGGRYVDEAKGRMLRYARTPFGFTRLLLHADPAGVKVADPGPGGKVTVSFPVQGVMTTATLDQYYRPAMIVQKVGAQRLEADYADYRDLAEYGVMFPTRIVEKTNGTTTADLKIDDARVSSYGVFPPPDGGAKTN
jgi:hypothetical protein